MLSRSLCLRIVLTIVLSARSAGAVQSPALWPATSPAGEAGLPRFVLQVPADAAVRDGEAFERQIATDADALMQAAASAPAGSERQEARLRAAAFLLGRQCEPPLSRILLEIAEAGDGRRLAEDAGRAEELLSEAEADFAASGPSGHAEPPAGRDAHYLAAVAGCLRAVGTVEAACAEGRAAAPDLLLAACQTIAPYLDDSRPTVADLARLLQAACYRRAGRAERTIELVGPPGTRPTAGLPYEYFARVEHCRALADGGHYAAAVAVALRLEARTGAWVPVADRTAAANGLRHLRVSLLREWSRELAARGESAASVAADAHAGRLLRAMNVSGPVAVYRLGRTLPEEPG